MHTRQPVAIDDFDSSAWPAKNLVVAVTTDKGLCGGVNSYITRGMKKVRIGETPTRASMSKLHTRNNPPQPHAKAQTKMCTHVHVRKQARTTHEDKRTRGHTRTHCRCAHNSRLKART